MRRHTNDDDTLLRDGERRVVSMMMHDSAETLSDVQRSIAGDRTVRRHWQDQADAHFGRSVRVTAGDGSTQGLHRPGARIAPLAQRDEALAQAYADADAALTSAWRHDAAPRFGAKPYGAYPYTAAAEGSECTINGQSGTLVKEGNFLICKPRKQQDAAVTDMATLYQQLDAELREAWRHQ